MQAFFIDGYGKGKGQLGEQPEPALGEHDVLVQVHAAGVNPLDAKIRNGEFKLVKYALIPINLKKPVKTADGKTVLQTYTPEIAESPEMLQLLKPFQDFGQQKLLVEVGSSDGKLEGDRSVVRSQPTALGVMIGQSMMEKAKADFAIVNAGGVRDSLPAGKLTYKDVLTVHPFGNTIVVVTLSGKEVMDYLNAAAKMTPGSGAFPQFAGVQLVIEGGKVQSAQVAGQAIDPSKTYRMAINNFVAAGGDGYPKLTTHPGYVDTGFVDADVLRAYIAANSPLKSQAYAPGNNVVRR